MKNKKIIIIILSILIGFCLSIFVFMNLNAKPSVDYELIDKQAIKVEAKSNNFFSSLLYICIDANENIDENTNWQIYYSQNTYELSNGNNYIHIKAKNNKCITCDKNEVTFINLNSNFNLPLYPIGEVLDVNYDFIAIGKEDIKINSNNEEVAYIEDNKIITKNKGDVTISISSENIVQSLDLSITDLYTLEDYSNDKPYLNKTICTDEENGLLDEVLKIKIEEAGYKTRAGVVAAARFLSLEFPYKLAYFSESGRLDTSHGEQFCDGEGRYYHYGLYLSESKYDEIENSVYGPKYWGSFFDEDDSNDHSLDEYYLGDGFVPADIGTHLYLSKRPNGLDCSGYVSWCYYNGGFNLGDIGAGGPTTYGMSTLGEFTYIDDELLQSNKIKAGDLVGYAGHIGIVIGVEENYIWIADTLPSGLKVTKFERNVESFESLGEDAWKYFMLMDDVYIEDGNYTAMW